MLVPLQRCSTTAASLMVLWTTHMFACNAENRLFLFAGCAGTLAIEAAAIAEQVWQLRARSSARCAVSSPRAKLDALCFAP